MLFRYDSNVNTSGILIPFRGFFGSVWFEKGLRDFQGFLNILRDFKQFKGFAGILRLSPKNTVPLRVDSATASKDIFATRSNYLFVCSFSNYLFVCLFSAVLSMLLKCLTATI